MIFFNIMDDNEPQPKRKRKVIIDEELIFGIANGDTAAFEEFYHLTERSLYAYVLSILKNHEETLDVMQDTYIKIRSAAHLYQSMGKPMAWVFTIAHNLAMNCIRFRNKIDNNDLENLEDSLSFSYVTNPEDRLVLKAALTILNEEERKIILQHAVSGLKHIEISRNLDIPLSTVLSKYHRGIKKLKKYLMDQEVL